VGSKQGILYMLFTDYLKYVSETFVNHWEENPKYLYHPLRCQPKARGAAYELQVKK